jgi:hypothetical protein
MADAPMATKRRRNASDPGARLVPRRIRNRQSAIGNPQSAIHNALPRLLAVALATAGGCKATIPVRQYPSFYDPAVRTVAVLDFDNRTLRGPAGTFLGRRVADALEANGTYKVIGPAALKGKLAAAGASIPQGADVEAVATVLRGLGGIDAFLAGSVTGFGADRSSHIEVDHFGYYGGYAYGWPRHGYRHGRWRGYGYGSYGYGGGYPTFWYYDLTRAHVAASASLIRTTDAAVLGQTPIPLSARLSSEDPSATADEVLTAAADAVADRIVEAFAVVPRKIKVDRDKLLRTARPGEGKSLRFTDDFRGDEDEMLAVVRLPRAAARNVFRLAVTRKSDDDVLAEKQFEWSARDGSRGFPFSPKRLVEAGDTEKYDLSLFVDDLLVTKREFRIRRRR